MNFGRTGKNYVVDVVMGFLFIDTAFSWKNYLAHIILGFALLIVIATHFWLHREWMMRQAAVIIKGKKRSSGWMTRLNFWVDLFIGTMFISSLASGLVMIVFSSIVWGNLHSFTSWMIFLGCLVHLFLHFTWIVDITKKLVTGRIRSQKDKHSLLQKELLN